MYYYLADSMAQVTRIDNSGAVPQVIINDSGISDGCGILVDDDDFVEACDFTVSCGHFRHEAVKHMTREEYMAEREKLFDLYDELLDSLRAGKGFSHRPEMKACFAVMMEPGEMPIYERLAPRFFQNYCGL